MKKAFLFVMAAGCAALAGVYCVIWTAADKKPPVIDAGNQELIYVDGMADTELIRGVRAEDERDGDVTKSLKVEQVYGNPDGKSVSVIYAARDSANNVAKDKVVYQRWTETDVEELSGKGGRDHTSQEDAGDQTALPAGTPDQVSGTGQTGLTDTPEGQLEDDLQMPDRQKEEMEQMAPERPKLYLKAYQTEVAVGSSFRGIEYVKEITDDKDTKEELWEQIQISGEVDTAGAGDYELIYVVRDSDGNYSNTARLTVAVR